MGDISRMIGARLVGDAELTAEKGGAQLRDKLFHGITFIAKAAREITVEPSFVAAPVREFMHQGGVEALRRTDGLRTGEPFTIRHLDMISTWPIVGTITVAGYEASIGLGHKLAKEYDFSRFGTWLDIAGGSGCYAIAACERNPDLQVMIMDQPNVIVVAQEFVAKHDLEARIDTMDGDFLETPFPGGHDLASYITPLQGYMPDEIIDVLRRSQEALKPGGEMLIIDYMLEDDKTGPLDPAFVNLAGVRRGRYLGRVNTGAEWCGFLAEAGYVNAVSRWFTPHQLGLITAQKPG